MYPRAYIVCPYILQLWIFCLRESCLLIVFELWSIVVSLSIMLHLLIFFQDCKYRNNYANIERLVILMYDRKNITERVNEAWFQNFFIVQNCRSIEGIPSTKSAVFQHTKRSFYQGGCVRMNVFVSFYEFECLSGVLSPSFALPCVFLLVNANIRSLHLCD